MKLIRIENKKNFYIEEIRNLKENWSAVIGPDRVKPVLDLDSKEFKKANKNPLKTFNLWVRVSKVVDGKQKSKKKLFKFDGVTIIEALKIIADEPDKLLSKFMDAEQEKQAKAEQESTAGKEAGLSDVWDKFYTHKTTGAHTKKWRDSTARTYSSFYDVWIRDGLGKYPISKITKADCVELIDTIAEDRTLRTATTAIEVLRPLFDWHFEEHEIDRRNPMPSKRNYQLNNNRVVELSLSQVKKLYGAIENYASPLFKDVFLWLGTGRRRGEVISLQLKHIDRESGSFTIKAENNKAKVDMTYFLRPELESTVPESDDPERYLFESPTMPGQPIHRDSIKRHWNSIKEKTGGTFKLNGERVKVDALHLHDIRHIIGGVLKKAGVPEEVRGKVLGHKKQGITDRYGADYYDDIDEAMQLFFDIVHGVVSGDTKWRAA